MQIFRLLSLFLITAPSIASLSARNTKSYSRNPRVQAVKKGKVRRSARNRWQSLVGDAVAARSQDAIFTIKARYKCGSHMPKARLTAIVNQQSGRDISASWAYKNPFDTELWFTSARGGLLVLNFAKFKKEIGSCVQQNKAGAIDKKKKQSMVRVRPVVSPSLPGNVLFDGSHLSAASEQLHECGGMRSEQLTSLLPSSRYPVSAPLASDLADLPSSTPLTPDFVRTLLENQTRHIDIEIINHDDSIQVLAFGGFIRPGSQKLVYCDEVKSKLATWTPDLLCWEVDKDRTPTGHYYRIVRKYSFIKSMRIIVH